MCITEHELCNPDALRTALFFLHHVRSDRLESKTRRSPQNEVFKNISSKACLINSSLTYFVYWSIAENGGNSFFH